MKSNASFHFEWKILNDSNGIQSFLLTRFDQIIHTIDRGSKWNLWLGIVMHSNSKSSHACLSKTMASEIWFFFLNHEHLDQLNWLTNFFRYFNLANLLCYFEENKTSIKVTCIFEFAWKKSVSKISVHIKIKHNYKMLSEIRTDANSKCRFEFLEDSNSWESTVLQFCIDVFNNFIQILCYKKRSFD